ncbi:MAG: Coenzyme F420 hydrogenase/dehydrogenase, beta subunit C-terminal domain [Methanosphaera sp.]|nr:Coenzyme F420 hydrogenase/dehydrogenase, beta subunit C-terminal domain [Methanosphaera sp.]
MKTQEEWSLNSIINSEQCAKCGTCTILCPNNILTFDDGPKLEDKCLRKGRGTCHEVCPRVSSGGYQIRIRENLKEDKYITKYSESDTLKNIIKYLLDNNEIDGALIVGSDHWKSLSLIIKEESDLDNPKEKSYKTSPLMALEELKQLNLEKIVIAALPCQISGFRKIQYFPYIAKHDIEKSKTGSPVKIPEIKYLIGEYCTGKYDYGDMNKVLKDEGIQLDDVKKFYMKSPNLIIETNKKTYTLKLKPIRMNSACKLCKDYEAELADISIGSHDNKTTSVIIRKNKLNPLKDVLNLEEDINDINKEKRERKIKRFNIEVKKREDEELPLSYYWNGDYPGVGKQMDGNHFIRLKVGKAGWYTTEKISEIVEISNKYNLTIKMTNRGAYELHDVKPKDVVTISEELKARGLEAGSEGPLVRSTIACPGSASCTSGIIDSISITNTLEDKFKEYPTPYKFKMAVTGCPNQCVRPTIHDIGVMGKRFTKINPDKCLNCGRCNEVCKLEAISYTNVAIRDENICIDCGKCYKACPHNAIELINESFEVYVGGKSGRQIIEGHKVNISTLDELYSFVEKVLIAYNDLSNKPQRERLADTINRIGYKKFINYVDEIQL